MDFAIDTTEYNQQSLQQGAKNTTSQIILKHTDKELKKVQSAPVSGVYILINGELSLVKESSEPTDKGDNEDYAYILRVTDKEEYAYHGKDLAMIFLNCQLTEQQGTALNNAAKTWLSAINSAFDMRSLTSEEKSLMSHYVSPNSNKS